MKNLEKNTGISELSHDELVMIEGGTVPRWLRFTPIGFAIYVFDEIIEGISEGLTTDCDTYQKPQSPFTN